MGNALTKVFEAGRIPWVGATRCAAFYFIFTVCGCTWSPYDNQEVDSATVTFGGWATAPNTVMTIEAKPVPWSQNPPSDGFHAVTTAVSDGVPVNSDTDLFAWGKNVTVPEWAWWPGSTPDGCLALVAFLRVRQGEFETLTFTPDAQVCTIDQISQGTSIVDAALACSTGKDLTVLRRTGICNIPEPDPFDAMEQAKREMMDAILAVVRAYAEAHSL